MIKALGQTQDGHPLAILGLSRGNIKNLQAGKPIRMPLSDVGGGDGYLIIMAGETEDSIMQDLTKTLGPPEKVDDYRGKGSA